MNHYDKLIFVSRSDTATSPMAEAILQKQFYLEDILISSKGLVVLFPEPINPKAEAILASHSLSMKSHMSEQLEEEDFDPRTLILTMDREQKDKLLREHELAQNVFTLAEYIQADEDIPDPYGGSLSDYGRCYDILNGQIARLTYILKAEERTQEEIAKSIRKSIALSVDKKTSVLVLTVTAQDPKVAARISEELISRLKTYVTNYRTEKSRQDLSYYETLYEESKAAYFESQQRYASYVDRNQGVILQRVKTEQERLQNEMNLNYQLYNACAQQLQSARAKVQQETPVFTIINPPQVPLQRTKPSKVKILFVCIFLGAMVAAVWILWGRDTIANFKKKDEEAAAPAKA